MRYSVNTHRGVCVFSLHNQDVPVHQVSWEAAAETKEGMGQDPWEVTSVLGNRQKQDRADLTFLHQPNGELQSKDCP